MQQLDGTRVRGCLVMLVHSQAEAMKRFFVGEHDAVVECELGIQPMSESNVRELMSERHGKAAFIWQHVQ